MPNHGKGGRPKKPNSIHQLEGTGRNDRGTDVVLELPKTQSKAPSYIQFSKQCDRKVMFKMMSDWTVSMTGAAQIDSIMLSMMSDVLAEYADAQAERDWKKSGQMIDRFHKLSREFGMTPATRDMFAKEAKKEENYHEGYSTRTMSYTDKAIKYSQDIVDGKITACSDIKLACQRFLDDLKRTMRLALVLRPKIW